MLLSTECLQPLSNHLMLDVFLVFDFICKSVFDTDISAKQLKPAGNNACYAMIYAIDKYKMRIILMVS